MRLHGICSKEEREKWIRGLQFRGLHVVRVDWMETFFPWGKTRGFRARSLRVSTGMLFPCASYMDQRGYTVVRRGEIVHHSGGEVLFVVFPLMIGTVLQIVTKWSFDRLPFFNSSTLVVTVNDTKIGPATY